MICQITDREKQRNLKKLLSKRWGGREGNQSLYNTDMKPELDHHAQFFKNGC